MRSLGTTTRTTSSMIPSPKSIFLRTYVFSSTSIQQYIVYLNKEKKTWYSPFLCISFIVMLLSLMVIICVVIQVFLFHQFHDDHRRRSWWFYRCYARSILWHPLCHVSSSWIHRQSQYQLSKARSRQSHLYPSPTPPPSLVLVKGELVKKENRKYYMKATMVDEDVSLSLSCWNVQDVVYAEATSLYIQSDVKKVIETLKEQESTH